MLFKVKGIMGREIHKLINQNRLLFEMQGTMQPTTTRVEEDQQNTI
jgi:hypothetical protein